MKFIIETTYNAVAYDAKQFNDLLETHKIVVLKQFGLTTKPLEFFNSLTNQLGYIYHLDEDLATDLPTGKRWIDITYDPDNPNKYRSAAVAQPLHTDCSYINIRDNVQFFYCESQAELGGSIVFMDSKQLVYLMQLANKDMLLERLLTTTVLFSKGSRTRNSTILYKDGEDFRLNWNYFCVDKNNSLEVMELVEEFHEFLEQRIFKSGLLREVLLEKNDIVFFHDELLLHGRYSYFATHKGQRTLNKGTLILPTRMKQNKGLIDFE